MKECRRPSWSDFENDECPCDFMNVQEYYDSQIFENISNICDDCIYYCSPDE